MMQMWSSGGAESELRLAPDSDGPMNPNKGASYCSLPVVSVRTHDVAAVCPISAVDVPFSQWSKDEVCGWLQEQGLGLYVAQCQSWVKSGQTILQASQHDLEKVRASSRTRRGHLKALFITQGNHFQSTHRSCA